MKGKEPQQWMKAWLLPQHTVANLKSVRRSCKPSSETVKFVGLMSRWHTKCVCKCATPAASCMMKDSTSCGGRPVLHLSEPWSRKLCKLSSPQKSATMVMVLQPWKTARARAKLGCGGKCRRAPSSLLMRHNRCMVLTELFKTTFREQRPNLGCSALRTACSEVARNWLMMRYSPIRASWSRCSWRSSSMAGICSKVSPGQLHRKLSKATASCRCAPSLAALTSLEMILWALRLVALARKSAALILCLVATSWP
mmetsp:Transcript_67755/g.209599  ORF Transcript_67755/g.209599 Transcript_67755/m.209599 type:complete len:254 (-) Transcript_67755:542-1303(-)